MNLKLRLATLLLAAATTCLHAQIETVPDQFATTHTAFLGNAGGIPGMDDFAQSAYRAAYDAVLKTGHYKLLVSPEKADLLIESSITKGLSDSSDANSYNVFGVQLRFIDPKSHATLWTLTVPLKTSRKAALTKNVVDGMAKLTAEINDLIAGKFPEESKDK